MCSEAGRQSSDECKQLEREHERFMQSREEAEGEQGRVQLAAMHDAYCALPENVPTDFCKGWQEWRASQDREL